MGRSFLVLLHSPDDQSVNLSFAFLLFLQTSCNRGPYIYEDTVGSKLEYQSSDEDSEPSLEPSVDQPEPTEPEDSSEPSSPEDSADECGDPNGTENANPTDLIGRVDCGEDIFFASCSVCHGTEGEGGDAGSTLNGGIDNYSDEWLADVIANGNGSRMPPINISPQQIADVIAWMRLSFEE